MKKHQCLMQYFTAFESMTWAGGGGGVLVSGKGHVSEKKKIIDNEPDFSVIIT